MRYVLYTLSKVMAPSMPFFAEYIFQKTRESSEVESVHLAIWPKTDKTQINKELKEKMDGVRYIVNLALAERIVKGLKVKQPLASLKVKNIKSKIKDEKESKRLRLKELKRIEKIHLK
jgi:isoleucyl-tRNA synthetase